MRVMFRSSKVIMRRAAAAAGLLLVLGGCQVPQVGGGGGGDATTGPPVCGESYWEGAGAAGAPCPADYDPAGDPGMAPWSHK